MPKPARILHSLLFVACSLPLYAAIPELSSIEPLEFDETAQRLVARGDARLDYGNTRLEADRITYYQEYALADADGHVALTGNGSRMIGESLSFDANENIFAVDLFRTGQWPYYISGVSAGGTTEEATINGATLYYGNPSPFGLSVSSESVQYIKNENTEFVKMGASTFRIGGVPILRLPAYTYYVDGTPYYIDVKGGHDSFLGTYLQTTSLFPVTSWLRAGLNLDYYSARGPLVGPAVQYSYSTEQQTMVGAFSSGFIQDQDDTGLDILNNSIDPNRSFVDWRHKHRIGERFNFTTRATYWSDSEVARDFREDIYSENQQPDTFAEGVYAGDNYLLSAFGRFRPNDFELVQERLPELRFDLLPVPIFKTGAYHNLSASYVQLRENFDLNEPLITEQSESDRLDLSYRIQRPILLRPWLTLSPLAGARITHYANQSIDPLTLGAPLLDDQFTRKIFELGFDLEARAYASYPTVNKMWGINGLRHLVRPVLRYRYFSDPDALNEIATIDRRPFNLERPTLDLSELRNVDTIAETHLTRLGVENLYQTRAAGYGSRTLAALNFYQDILFEKGVRYDGENENTFHATWVELELNPAPWLKFDLASRFNTESLTLEEMRTRTSIRSGETWELGLSTDFINQQIDQYRLDFMYRLNERYAFLTDLRLDAESGELTESRFGLRTRLGSTWELLYALTFREAARRESDVEFSVRVRLAQP
ncbi:MAG: LPS-assembly protein [Lentimonas sp.]